MAVLVQQLRDPSFSRRRDADHQLRAMGQNAVSFLNRLDERTLDAEQRTRIRQIKQSLHVHDGDTPARVAAWLADDPAVWLALLERENEATRTVAAKQLEAILGHTLAFNPAAGESERRQEVRRLRAELGLARPVLVGDAGGAVRR
jgi:hypothetical protein